MGVVGLPPELEVAVSKSSAEDDEDEEEVGELNPPPPLLSPVVIPHSNIRASIESGSLATIVPRVVVKTFPPMFRRIQSSSRLLGLVFFGVSKR